MLKIPFCQLVLVFSLSGCLCVPHSTITFNVEMQIEESLPDMKNDFAFLWCYGYNVLGTYGVDLFSHALEDNGLKMFLLRSEGHEHVHDEEYVDAARGKLKYPVLARPAKNFNEVDMTTFTNEVSALYHANENKENWSDLSFALNPYTVYDNNRIKDGARLALAGILLRSHYHNLPSMRVDYAAAIAKRPTPCPVLPLTWFADAPAGVSYRFVDASERCFARISISLPYDFWISERTVRGQNSLPRGLDEISAAERVMMFQAFKMLCSPETRPGRYRGHIQYRYDDGSCKCLGLKITQGFCM